MKKDNNIVVVVVHSSYEQEVVRRRCTSPLSLSLTKDKPMLGGYQPVALGPSHLSISQSDHNEDSL